MILALRRNIGTIVTAFGFILLCILTFGDLGEIVTEEYWQNVRDNITSLTFSSIALTMIQVMMKQGLGEQALQKGMNTDNTKEKYIEHKDIIKKSNSKIPYMPYFLQEYNERHTILRKREFLADNNFLSEKELFVSKAKKLIRKYKSIRTCISLSRIKWATTDITYNKKGQIQTLGEYRTKRLMRGITYAFIFMIGVTLLTRGLFFEENDVPLYQKFVKLITYIVVITMTSVFSIIKEFEKGAFGIPNELEEINEIWREFDGWSIPAWVMEEVKQREVNDEKEITANNNGRSLIQEKQEENVTLPEINTNS